MIEVDLHGMRHKEAEDGLERMINSNWGTNADMHIITGHSPRMKEIVIDILERYKLEYTIGDWAGVNTGFIRTYLD
jgi:hypothetical protein